MAVDVLLVHVYLIKPSEWYRDACAKSVYTQSVLILLDNRLKRMSMIAYVNKNKNDIAWNSNYVWYANFRIYGIDFDCADQFSKLFG